jgi:hypothetical protein
MATIICDAILIVAAVPWWTLKKDEFRRSIETPKVWFGFDKSAITVSSSRTFLTLNVVAFIENEVASFDCVCFCWALFTLNNYIITLVCTLYCCTLSLRIYFEALRTFDLEIVFHDNSRIKDGWYS